MGWPLLGHVLGWDEMAGLLIVMAALPRSVTGGTRR
jgi:hypothetical protein